MLFLLISTLLSLPAQAADRPSVHGMLLFGKSKVYVSHLPMFHSPHDYQLIAELELPADAAAAYQESLRQHPGEKIYTLVPETLVLPALVVHPRAIVADLYRGHFERGGEMIAESVTVKLAKVLHWRKFAPDEAKPAQGAYLLFGTPEEAFLAHFLVSKPDFDQVIELGPNAAAAAGEAFRVEDPAHDDTHPLPVPGTLELRKGAVKVRVELRRELYLETGDLAL